MEILNQQVWPKLLSIRVYSVQALIPVSVKMSRSLFPNFKKSSGGASGIDGIDIEFVDAMDGRRKYCQCKAGPKTINKDDITTFLSHFKYLMNKSRLDRMGLQFDDLVVGVLYGEKGSLSAFYKAIDTHYPVLCGSDFWMHLTGDETFYHRLAKAFGEVVDEDGIDGSALILAKVEEIAEEIIQKGGL